MRNSTRPRRRFHVRGLMILVLLVGGVLGLISILGMLLLWSLALVGLIDSTPVVLGLHSPISLLIFGIGLWQAWVMTRAGEWPVTGPYRVRG